MPVQYNAKPPKEYLCQLSKEIMNEPICVKWQSGRTMICDRDMFQRLLNGRGPDSIDQSVFLPTEARLDLKCAICRWKKEHSMEKIDPANLGELIAENRLDQIDPDQLNAYLRYVFAMAKTNDVVKYVVGKTHLAFEHLYMRDGVDDLSKCVLQLILSEARCKFEREQRNKLHPDPRECYHHAGQGPLQDPRDSDRSGSGAISYTPAVYPMYRPPVGERAQSMIPAGFLSQANGVVATWETAQQLGQGVLTESPLDQRFSVIPSSFDASPSERLHGQGMKPYIIWSLPTSVGGETPPFQGESLLLRERLGNPYADWDA